MWLRRAGISVGVAFSSALSRSVESLRLMVGELSKAPREILIAHGLNERDYRKLSGLNKDEARERWGWEQVQLWRSYEGAPPDGESLRDVVARVAPFYVRSILPEVLRGNGTLVVTHGNEWVVMGH